MGQKVRSGLPFQQRQASPPVVVRHVFTTSGQGIPVTMAVLPQGSALSPEVSLFDVQFCSFIVSDLLS